MKRTDNRTAYILIKAYANSEWDNCEFAIIHITGEWCNLMLQRLNTLQQFQDDFSFHALHYWDSPEGFYKCPDEWELEEMLLADKEWGFVMPDDGELENLPVPENALDCYQLVLNRYGTAYFTACGKHTGEDFYTESFDIRKWTMSDNTIMI